MRRVLLRVRAADKAAVAAALKEVFDLDRVDDDPERAAVRLKAFIGVWKRRYPGLPALFPDDLIPLLFTCLQLPPELRRMLYTTNWIERLNKHVRKATRNRNSFPNEASLLNAVFLAVMDFENRVYSYPIYQVAALSAPL
jgi:putative transposase